MNVSQEITVHIQDAQKYLSLEDYEKALLRLQQVSFELLVKTPSQEELLIYEQLKKDILSHTNYSEYCFPALVDKNCFSENFTLVTEEFQANANEKDILLTVFLVTFNQEKTIAKCIESVLQQETQYKYKIFILEDCSTDNTLDICREYESKYPELIEVIAQPSNTFNNEERHFRTALRTCLHTPYWTAIEGDDFWIDARKIQTALTFLENNTEYVGVGSNWINNNLETQEKSLGIPIQNFTQSVFTVDNFTYLHTTTRFYRNVINFSSCPLSQEMSDSFIYFEFLLRGPFYYYNKVTSVYNVGTGIWSSMSSEEKNLANKKVFEEFYVRALKKYHLVETQCRNLEEYLFKIQYIEKSEFIKKSAEVRYNISKLFHCLFETSLYCLKKLGNIKNKIKNNISSTK